MAGSPGDATQATALNPLLPRLLFATTLVMILVTGLALAWHSMGGLDIWFHDRAGSDLLEGNNPAGSNTYSFTEPEHLWINHEWLFQVLVALTGGSSSSPGDISDSVHGWNILRLCLIALLLTVLLLGDGLRVSWLNHPEQLWGRLWLALPLLLGMGMLWTRFLLRPEILSYLGFILMVRVLDRPLDQWLVSETWRDLLHPARPLGQTFWLTVLWNQVHGFSALAPVLLLLKLLSSILESRVFPQGSLLSSTGKTKIRWGVLWAAIPGLILALALSPNGLMGIIYPLKALGQFSGQSVDLRHTISELVPLLETRDSLGYSLGAYKLSLVWGLVWIIATWGHISLFRVLLWALATWAAFAGQRNLGFYALAFMLLHTGPVGFSYRWSKYRPQIHWPRMPLALVGVVMVLGISLPWLGTIFNDSFYLHEGVSRRFGSGETPARYPVVASRLLAAVPGQKLICNVDAAAFLLNRARVEVFIDGRTEAYPIDRWQQYNQIRKANQPALNLLYRSSAQKIFLSTGSGSFKPLAGALLTHGDWQLDHFDAAGFLFSRAPGREAPSDIPKVGHKFATLAGVLPADDTDISPARAADICVAWASTMELGQNSRLQEEALRQALQWHPEHPTALHNLGNIQMTERNWEEAQGYFEKALSINPRLSGSALNAGVCLLQGGKRPAAIEKFRQSIGIDGKNFQAWANLGMALMADGKPEEAKQAILKALALQPGDPRLRQVLNQLGL